MGIVVDIACRVTGVLIDDEQGGFRVRRECVVQIFTLKQIGDKALEKKHSVYMYREALC